MKEWGMLLGGLVVLCLVIWGGWKIKRAFNYSFDYKDQVVQTIKETVKPSCLK